MYGLVLAGGGARGAYQIGAWKALRELGIDIKIVCGTSVGALNGAFIAQNKFKEALDLWQNISMDSIFRDDNGIFTEIDHIYQNGITEANFSTIKNLYTHFTQNKGLNIDPLRELIDSLLDYERLQSSGIEFGFVTVNLSNKKSEKIFASQLAQEELKHHLLGSASFPGFNQSKDSPNKFFDGGIIDNLPIKMVKEKGYKDIIAINLRNARKPNIKDINLTYIAPSEALGSLLHFNQDHSKRHILMGYYDTLKAFHKVNGIKYYFTNIPTEKDIIQVLLTMPIEDRLESCNVLKIKESSSDRYLLEKILTKLSTKLGSKQDDTYVSFLFSLLERYLRETKKERLKTYDCRDLLQSLFDEEMNIYQSIIKALQ